MSKISKLLLKDPLYASIIENASIVGAQLEMNIFLVGGFVRDLLLNRTLIDIDLMVEGNASDFAKKLSEKESNTKGVVKAESNLRVLSKKYFSFYLLGFSEIHIPEQL